MCFSIYGRIYNIQNTISFILSAEFKNKVWLAYTSFYRIQFIHGPSLFIIEGVEKIVKEIELILKFLSKNK